MLTPGQAHDMTQAPQLIAGLPLQIVIADTSYDADHFRDRLNEAAAQAVIPSSTSRAGRLPLDADLYKERHLVECCINKLKHFRRIATRYEKTAAAFAAMITVAGIALWLR